LSAHAATITADPAEVIFYSKNSTKQKSSTIAWDAGGGKTQALSLHYKINGAGETQWVAAAAVTDTKTANFIKVNNTYEFCLWANSHTEKLACVTVTTKVNEIKIDLGFIHNIKVEPAGHSVKISFTTDRNALAIVQVADKEPKKPFPFFNKDDVPAFDPADVVSTSFPSVNKKSHSPTLPKLEPGKTFFFVIAAKDKQTDLWFKVKGTFDTLRRRVDVNFASVKVVDDSDDLSAGDLVFGFFINGQNKATNGKPMTFSMQADTGQTKSVNLNGRVTGAPQTLTLKATGYDDDEMEFIPLGPFVVSILGTCGFNATDANKSEGQNSCGEWTSGSASFDLEALAENAANPEDFTQSFKIQARPKGDDSEVKFDVMGTFRVRYVP